MAASSPLTLAEDYARRQLASSARFQALTNSPSADAALAHVFIDSVYDPETGDEYEPQELAGLAPFAVVSSTGEQALVMTPIGTASYDDGGVLQIEIWLPATGSTAREILRNAKEAIAEILFQMTERAEEHGHLARPLVRLMEIERIDKDDRPDIGDLVIGSAEMAWGSLRAEGD